MRCLVMVLSVKDRVYAAAEEISVERRPTVSTVRAAAGVSNADATRFLKEWNEEKRSAGGQVAATPPALLEQAARLAGAVWAEASAAATERHAGLETAWVLERGEKDQEIAELVADLDKATAANEAAAAEHKDAMARVQEQRDALERQLAVVTRQLEESRGNEREAAMNAAEASRKLATAEARAATLEQVHAALLARVAPEKPKSDS
ncbi:DNA-binding protein [Paenarthrobacter ureafaciens]|uniref:DNA-binding protein n=1 Tax=Paenarthrobacter ureafaciens TaxID=37931 RepID=UPI0020C1D7A5|nr:DNA-binding protein [Paenarthrobacter ureafaciens]